MTTTRKKKTAKKKVSSNGANRIKDKLPIDGEAEIQIQPPKLQVLVFQVKGLTPYLQNKFSQRAREEIRKQQEKGSAAAATRKKRKPKDFRKVAEEARHVSHDGWSGIPANSFRDAMISACRICGFQMVRAKLAIRILEDGFDRDDESALVRIKGRHKMDVRAVRPQPNVMDLAARPLWTEWSCTLSVEYDADLFTAADITNLLMRAGRQVGIGCGRPDSKQSSGIGYGLFDISASK